MEGMMARHQAWEQHCPSGLMRVVILEPVAENRDILQAALQAVSGFQLVGMSSSWEQCQSLVEVFLPELLIARTNGGAELPIEELGRGVFPVVVALKTKDFCAPVEGVFETVEMPFDPKMVSATMQRARMEIYRRKLDEVSALLGRYMSFSPGPSSYVTSIRADENGSTQIPAERVMFLSADGNYVRVHTGAGVHEIRDTMSAMTAKLDPTHFARVHRSFIVNRSHVANVVRRDGTATCVLLSNGAEIPVGPNYRSEVEGFESLSRRLSA